MALFFNDPKVTNSAKSNSVLQVTFPLLSLPNVVIHHLAGYLDPESTLFVGATCVSLGKIISKRLLARDAAILSNIIGGLETLTRDLVQVNIVPNFIPSNKAKNAGCKSSHKLWSRI